MRNEPVRIQSIIAGLLVAVATALGAIAVADPITTQTILTAASVSLLELAVVIGGGEFARSKAYGPETVEDHLLDADTVLDKARRAGDL